MTEVDKLIAKLRNKHYNTEDVKPKNPNQTLTDEALEKLFNSLEGKYYEISLLKKILEGKIKVNTENPKVSVISSTYLSRLGNYTGNRWRQKRALGKNEEALVKFYTDGKYKKRSRKKSK